MAIPEGPLLEHRLRQALTPPPDRVERIVRQALAAGSPEEGRARARRPLHRLVPAASLLALLTTGAIVVSIHFPAPHPASPPRRPSVVSIVNVGGVVIASSPEEQRPLILSGTGETDPPGIILIRHGLVRRGFIHHGDQK
jgi:hypothetical protein